MTRIGWLWILFAIRAALYAASFIVAHYTAPTGSGFTRGLNRLMVFFQFQIAAGGVALVVWMLGRAFDRGTWHRWLSRAPALLAVGLLLLIVGIIIVANIGKPSSDSAPYVPPEQVSGPAKDAQ